MCIRDSFSTNDSFFDLATWIFAIIGGVIVAAVWQAITRRTGTRA